RCEGGWPARIAHVTEEEYRRRASIGDSHRSLRYFELIQLVTNVSVVGAKPPTTLDAITSSIQDQCNRHGDAICHRIPSAQLLAAGGSTSRKSFGSQVRYVASPGCRGESP